MDELLKVEEGQQPPDPFYVDFIKRLLKAVENRLIQRVGLATKCSAWNAFPKAKQVSIMQMGFFDPIDPKHPSAKEKQTTNVRRNHSLNAAKGDPIPKALPTQPFQRTTFRSTVHSGRNLKIPQAVDRTPGITSSSVRNVQQRSNPRSPVVVPISKSYSVRQPNQGTSRNTTSRPSSNLVAISSQKAVNSIVSETR